MIPATDAALLGQFGVLDRYAGRMEAHLTRLAHGHDPFGHLLSIERLARAARAEWQEELRSAGRNRGAT